ncbi:hypothetical protein [Aeromicrobium sp. 179-A 4D2 NHS]|uniref:hypothetical protein n=1 Tax=Aeromicrobium sp. 179-A 4D2 NHS TaxID=3142375 RepID=UPI0039A2CBD2
MNEKWAVIRRWPEPSGGFVTLKATPENRDPVVDEKAIISLTRHSTVEEALDDLTPTERKTAVVHPECHQLVPFDTLRFHTNTSEQFNLDEARYDIGMLIAQIYDLHGALQRAENRIADLEEAIVEMGD